MKPTSLPLARAITAALLVMALPTAPAAPPAARPSPRPPAAAPQPPAAAPAAPTRCIDEERFDAATGGETAPAAGASANDDPRSQLDALVRAAVSRSQAVGASQLLVEAAEQDIEEAKAGKQLQASIGGTLGPQATYYPGYPDSGAVIGRAALTLSQVLYDSGRTAAFTGWRAQLAEASRQGNLSQREQVAVNTVALALERSRWRTQLQVYGQYVRKMACLVDALETIVKSDRGRASELVQAKKSLAQAELSVSLTQSQLRQTEVRLARFVGDTLPPPRGLAGVLLTVPELDRLQADVERSPEIEAMAAQATAADRYADAVATSAKPTISWNFTGTHSSAAGGSSLREPGLKNNSVGLGVAVNIPLLSPGTEAAGSAAKKRAQAAWMQREDAVQSRRYRVAEVHEQTQSAFDRARRTGAVLRDSEQVRNFTLQQWQQLGRRSLFDVMSAEAEHYNLIAYVNALHDGQQLNAVLLSLGRGVSEWLR